MKLRLNIIHAFVIAQCFLCTVAQSAEIDSAITSVPPTIDSIVICGFWEDHGKRGQYRTISVYRYARHELYIQRIADPDIALYPDASKSIESNFHVIHTLSIAEFNCSHCEYTLDSPPACSSNKRKNEIVLTASNAHDGKKYRFKIELSDDANKYKLTKKVISKKR